MNVGIKMTWRKRLCAANLALCFVFAAPPFSALAAGDGWTQTGDGWRYYHNGEPLTGACWLEAEKNRYLFDENGILQTGGATGDVLWDGGLYYINPEKNPADPATCYAVRNYSRCQDWGVSYYNADGITFAGWMLTPDGRRMYQTCLPQGSVDGADRDVYIYVWRAQYLPAGTDPADPAHTIPEGWYLFDDSGLLVQTEGWHNSGDGAAYYTNTDGQILQTGAQGNYPSADERPAEAALRLWNTAAGTQAAILEKTNALRIAAGVNPLAPDASLHAAAQLRAMEMARTGTLSHTRPGGKDCFTVYEDFGWTFDSRYLGENIARLSGVADPDACVCESWKNSPNHYRNMVDPDFTRMGVGVYTAPDGRRYYAQLFAAEPPRETVS